MKSFRQYLLEQNTESPAPYGALKIEHPDGRPQWIIGVRHGEKVEISDPELQHSIIQHGKQYGHYYEGTGNGTDIKQPKFGLSGIDDYKDGWDTSHARTIAENGIKPHHLSTITANVDTNWDAGIREHFQNPEQTVFNGIVSWCTKNSKEMFGGAQVTPKHVEKYLQANGLETGVDWLHKAQTTPATQGKEFLKDIERIAWPKDWATRRRETGPEQLADMMSTERNEHLLGMGPGVYWAGAGHVLQLIDILKEKGIKYKFYGGEQAHR